MLYLCKKNILSNLFFKHKPYIPSSWRHFVSATSFCANYPLRHWLPLTVWLPLTRRINLDSSKRKVEQISFRKYSRCDAWRVTDINSIYPRHVQTCLMSIATNKGADQPAAQSEQHPLFRFFDSRISTDVKASLIMLKLKCQWCSWFLWLRRLVWILPGRPRNP